jgi:hypothetical protein
MHKFILNVYLFTLSSIELLYRTGEKISAIGPHKNECRLYTLKYQIGKYRTTLQSLILPEVEDHLESRNLQEPSLSVLSSKKMVKIKFNIF